MLLFGYKYSIEYPLAPGYRHAIVGDGYIVLHCALDPPERFFAVEHAAAAVDYEFEIADIFRVISAGSKSEIQGFAGGFFQHCR